MANLTAKILIAKFVNKSIFDESEEINTYSVYEFSNGLILVPSETTNDWFFQNKDSIEGCGNDLFVKAVDTEDTISFSKKELADSWGNSVREFKETSCLKLVHKLLCH